MLPPPLRVAFNAVDPAPLLRVRSLAHRPRRVRWIRRYSHLGEHGAVWLGWARAGAGGRWRRRPWVRATGCVGAAYLISTSIKLAIGRKRPVIEDLPHLMATPTGLSFPSSHSTSSFAAAQAYGRAAPARSAAGRGGRDGVLAALPGRALPVGRRGRRGARHRAREPSGDEGRHRRDAQRGQVVALQRALARRRGGGHYPFTTIEPNVAVVPVADERLDAVARTVGASNVVPDTIEFHDIAGLVAGAHKGEGLGNKFLANIRETDALLHVVRAHGDENVIHPEGRVDPAADIETIETELCTPISSRPSAVSPGWWGRRAAATRWRSPNRRGSSR